MDSRLTSLIFFFAICLSAALVHSEGGDEFDRQLPKDLRDPEQEKSDTAPNKSTDVAPPSPTTPKTTDRTTPTSEPTPKTTTTERPPKTTTTESPPQPTPPVVDPEQGDWNLTRSDKNRTVCLLSKMAIQFKIPYQQKGNRTGHAVLNVPKTADASGSCGVSRSGGGDQVLSLIWKAKDAFGTNNVTLLFGRNDSADVKQFYLRNITAVIILDPINFPNNSATFADDRLTLISSKELDIFSTPLNHSYKCNPSAAYNLTVLNVTKQDQTLSQIIFSKLQLEPYYNGKSGKFSDARLCSIPDVSDFVPIAVGCALAALVVIVLVAYLIGRRRSRARGYQSV